MVKNVLYVGQPRDSRLACISLRLLERHNSGVFQNSECKDYDLASITIVFDINLYEGQLIHSVPFLRK